MPHPNFLEPIVNASFIEKPLKVPLNILTEDWCYIHFPFDEKIIISKEKAPAFLAWLAQS